MNRLVSKGPDGLEVLKRDGWVCQLCGVSTPESLRGFIHPDAPEIGHIIPLVAGGLDEVSNLRCECHFCNTFKGPLTDKELLAEFLKRAKAEKPGPIRHQRRSEILMRARDRGVVLGRPRNYPKATVADLRALLDSGFSVRKAARRLKISYGLAYRWTRGLNSQSR
jgi:HNH endonuclease